MSNMASRRHRSTAPWAAPSATATAPSARRNASSSRMNQRRGGPRRIAPSTCSQMAPSALLQLPYEVLTQFVVPQLTWQDTSAMACVCRRWHSSLRAARAVGCEWKCMKARGNTHETCVHALTRQLGQGGNGGLCFPPTIMVATLSYADVRDIRQSTAFWNALVASMTRRNAIPMGCTLVGMLQRDGSHAHNADDVDPADAAAVTVSLSMGCFPETRVDSAAFDRRDLRWSASGFTDELGSPFEDMGGDQSDDAAQTSLLLFSGNQKSARVLLSLASTWYPSAPITGGVVELAGQAAPLMLFKQTDSIVMKETRHRQKQPKRHSKSTRHRNQGRTTQSRPSLREALSFPSSLLLRCHGAVRLNSFAVSFDQAISDILLCHPQAELDGPDQLLRDDFRLYKTVSVVDHTGVQIRELRQVLHDAFGMANVENTKAMTLSVYASTCAHTLRTQSRCNEFVDQGACSCFSNSLGSVGSQFGCSRIRRIPFHAGERGALTVGEHWEEGEFGIVCIQQAEDQTVLHEKHLEAYHIETRRKKTLPFGCLLLNSRFPSNGGASISAGAVCAITDELDAGECVVDWGIGPLPTPSRVAFGGESQLQVGSVCGAFFDFTPP